MSKIKLSLSDDKTPFASISVSKYDTETFGFKTGTLVDINWDVFSNSYRQCAEIFSNTAQRHNVEVISCAVPAKNNDKIALLQLAGFDFVECRIVVTGKYLKQPINQRGINKMRTWVPADREKILAMSSTEFIDGRFISDVRFPTNLAHKRNATIMRQTMDMTEKNHGREIYVLGPEGNPHTFNYVWNDGKHCILEVGAADTSNGTIAAFMNIKTLWNAVVDVMRLKGVKTFEAQIGAANTAISHVYVGMGFMFNDTEIMFHWHNPNSDNLNTLS